jgi:hypothetical protein
MRSSHKFTAVLECALWCISQSDTVCTLSCRDDISLSFFSKDFVLKEAMLPEHRHAPPSTHVHCELPLWSYGDCSSWTRVSRDIFTQSWMKWKKWKTALFKSSQKNIKENESKINVLNATFISLQEYSKQRCQYEQPPGRLETLTLSMVFFLQCNVSRCKTVSYKNNFYVRAPSVWNILRFCIRILHESLWIMCQNVL